MGLLINLLIFLLVIYVVHLIIEAIGLPPEVRKVVILILAIVFLIFLLRMLFGPFPLLL